jgi:hypothetical protein
MPIVFFVFGLCDVGLLGVALFLFLFFFFVFCSLFLFLSISEMHLVSKQSYVHSSRTLVRTEALFLFGLILNAAE